MRNGQWQGRLISFLKNIDQMRYELNHISRICTKPFLTLLMSMHGFFFYGRFISVVFINLLLILFYQYAVLFALAIHVSLTIPVQCRIANRFDNPCMQIQNSRGAWRFSRQRSRRARDTQQFGCVSCAYIHDRIPYH
jgi:hypothetical protein